MAAIAADGDVGEWRMNNDAMARFNVRKRCVDDLVMVMAVVTAGAIIVILIVIRPTVVNFDDGSGHINHGGAQSRR